MEAKKDISPKAYIIDWIRFGLMMAAIYFGVTHSFGLTRVFGHSMDPTLKDGSLIAVNKLTAHLGKPKFGDVVIIHEKDKGYDIIKRVIGQPGDTVTIKKGVVYVNGAPLPEIYTLGKSADMEEVTVSAGHIFIMGDNRTPGESLDSRDPSIGQVPASMVKGYALISLFPIYRIMMPLKL